jgi:hypothetical protein
MFGEKPMVFIFLVEATRSSAGLPEYWYKGSTLISLPILSQICFKDKTSGPERLKTPLTRSEIKQGRHLLASAT